jgi:HSP20 family molecular chaperone IbpA
MSPETQEIQAREKEAVARERARPGPVFRPDVDIAETADAWLVFADLPGVDERHVSVELREGVLSIDGELASAPEAGWAPMHAEYRVGAYHREFTLSEDVEAEGISAKMRDGVLELRLPKSAKRRPRRIEITNG